ncbi:MAG: glutathione S-transferase family protein [Proteobacteria bacterium]|nr:glutathione S-transferase family protein [Pseudomonadota bacterium]MDA1059598.1 glutathione S-transferase family protein [Pseudomonadota bacterium]
MITLYGGLRSRASRCAWALNELGVDYQRDLLPDGGHKKPEYLKINPAGKAPALKDGDVVMSESLAINLYLARKYDNGLWPSSEADQAAVQQWTIWAACEAEPSALTIAVERFFKPEDQRDEAKAKEAEETLKPRLAYVDSQLKGKKHLVGGSFSIADINVACVLASTMITNVDLSPYPDLKRWLTETAGRAAYTKAREG